MKIFNTDEVKPWKRPKDMLAKFDGDLTWPFHHIRQCLHFAWIVWHQSKDSRQVVRWIKSEATPLVGVYSRTRFKGIRDEFEMALAMAIALTDQRDLAEDCRRKFIYRPCSNGYAYYVGFKKALLGLMLDDRKLVQDGKTALSRYNADKCFYFPSDSVIFAALDGDMKKLKSSVKAISAKFDGYAQKMSAISKRGIDAEKLDHHWFTPYPDWAFYAQAIRRRGPIDAPSSIWMPMDFLNSFAAKGKQVR